MPVFQWPGGWVGNVKIPADVNSRHAGQKLDDAPAKYLDWLVDRPWLESWGWVFAEALREYVKTDAFGNALDEELGDAIP